MIAKKTKVSNVNITESQGGTTKEAADAERSSEQQNDIVCHEHLTDDIKKMICSTVITKLSSGLVLVESIDDETLSVEFPNYKSQTKAVLRSIDLQSDPKCTIEAGAFNFHYSIDHGVCYLCLTDRLFPKRLAFTYLDELSELFLAQYGAQMEAAHRPYAFIKFDTVIQRVKKNYKDSRNQQNLTRLNEELHNVTKIMTKNIQDVVQRGEKIDKLSFLSTHLVGESKKYAKETRMLNLRALYRKYGWPLLLLLIFVILFYFYWIY